MIFEHRQKEAFKYDLVGTNTEIREREKNEEETDQCGTEKMCNKKRNQKG